MLNKTCPHCQQSLQLPDKSETLISVGFLLSVIVAPLNYFWFAAELISYGVFAVGILFILTGIINNQLRTVSTTLHYEKK